MHKEGVEKGGVAEGARRRSACSANSRNFCKVSENVNVIVGCKRRGGGGRGGATAEGCMCVCVCVNPVWVMCRGKRHTTRWMISRRMMHESHWARDVGRGE